MNYDVIKIKWEKMKDVEWVFKIKNNLCIIIKKIKNIDSV